MFRTYIQPLATQEQHTKIRRFLGFTKLVQQIISHKIRTDIYLGETCATYSSRTNQLSRTSQTSAETFRFVDLRSVLIGNPGTLM